ncbi:hypothetical protein [Maribacter sp. 2307UL18-2]|uniref:hypothetical protein n=1 Tax=Maribacter sp. 2307UL18-2 TaxID=3386274 RepID=UPI0039BCD607
MQYLSKEIEALAKKRPKKGSSLIKKEYSCGIFQDYGEDIPKKTLKNKDATL